MTTPRKARQLTPTPVARAARSAVARAAAASATNRMAGLEGLEARLLFSDVPFVAKTPLTTTADMAHAVFTVDLDGDGDMDVVSASQGNNTVAWYRNDGAGNFTPFVISNAQAQVGGLYAVDLDKDGDVDVLSAAEGGRTVWYENNGSESFTAHDISTTDTHANVVFAADLDKDGDLDVVTDEETTQTLVWYENNGSQGFTRRVIASTVGTVKGVYVADVDKDGNPDVISGSQDSNKVIWYEGSGTGTFTAHTIDSNAVSSRSVVAADLDGDGDIDIAEASFGDNTVAWYQNNGSQVFTKKVITSSAMGADGVYAADVDGDGDLDLLSSSFVDDRVLWFENVGSGNFTTRVIATNADQAQDVSAADFDGDGDLDVVSASWGDDKVAWYQNTGGRLKADATAVAPATLGNGQSAALLTVTATHLGTADDHADRVSSIRVRLVAPAASTSLTTDQANALIDTLAVYRDSNGNGTFDSADALVQSVDTLALDGGGGQSFVFSDPADANTFYGPGAPATFFVVAQLTATAATATPNAFRVSGVDASARDRIASPERGLVGVTGTPAFSAAITASATPTTPTPTTPTPTTPTPTPTPTATGTFTAGAEAVLPESAVSGEKTKGTVRVTVTNTTSAPFNGPVAVNLFTSTDGALDSADQPLISVTKKLKLKVNQAKVVKVSLKEFPAALPDGTYQVLAQVTPAGGNPAVAAAAGTTNVAAPFFNLSGATTGPAKMTIGKNGKASVVILNSGNVTLASTIAVAVQAVPFNGDPSAAVDLTVAAPVKLKIAAGKTKKVSVKFAVPTTLPAGQYLLASTLDTGNAVVETDEADNASTSGTPTTAA